VHRTRLTRVAGVLLAAAAGLAVAAPAFGLVLFPTDASPPPVRPNDAVIGRWFEPGGTLKASCVAIAPSYVVTTRHQGGGVGYSVTIAGATYPVLEVFEDDAIDIRIARIAANLTYTIAPYTAKLEAFKTVVIGGYGRPRGAELKLGGLTYGYEWGPADQVLRWGANRVDSISTGTSGTTLKLTSDVLVAHFDDFGSTAHKDREAAPAEFDSGGGWFIDVSPGGTGDWRLAALTRFTERAGQTWFKNPDGTPHPDVFDGIRIRSYAGWLNGVIKPSTWIGGSGAWSTAAQWSPAGKPNAADQWAVFGNFGPGALTVTLDQDVTVGTLRFDGYTNYTISGPSRLTFSVTSGTAGIESNRLLDPLATGAATIAVPITLSASLLVNHNSGGTLTLSGAVSGAGGIIKDKGGTLVLANSNTYSGGTVLKGGTLRASAPGAFGSGQITLAGGTLDAKRDTSVIFPNSVLVSGDTTVNVDRNASGTGRTVTFGGLTVGGDWKLTAKGGNGYGLAFSGATLFQGTTGTTVDTVSADVALSGGVSLLAGSLTKTGPKALTIAGPQNWGAGTVLNVSGGTVRLNADTGTSALFNVTLNVAGAQAELGSTQHLAALNLSGGGVASMTDGGGKVLVTQALAIEGAASKLDIAGSSLIVAYSGASPLDRVAGLIRTGYNDGDWAGNGIASRAAAVDPITYGIGYSQNGMLFAPYDHFAGQPVDSSTILVKFTYNGDLNLDGCVDDNDVTFINLFYDGGITTSHYWNEGDIFGYDGRIDDNDVTILGLTYGSGIGHPLAGGDDVHGDGAGASSALADSSTAPVGGSPLPEPATLALMALGVLGLMRRRV